MDHHDERQKRAFQRVTDKKLVTLISHLRAGASVFPTAARGADELEQELKRRCDAHLEMFGLG